MNILITGGSSGIGRAVANACARSGHNLILVARNRTSLEKVKKQITKDSHVTVDTISADISDPSQVKKIKTYCRQHSCPPDVVVMCAGIFISGKISKVQPQDIEKIMNTNVFSMFHFAREFVPVLRKRKNPKIIIIGSTAGTEPHKSDTYGSLYSTSKWAVRGLAFNLRKELAPSGIGVTHIAPGSVMTEMWGSSGQPNRMLEASDIGRLIVAILELSPKAVVEEIVVRPMRGNI